MPDTFPSTARPSPRTAWITERLIALTLVTLIETIAAAPVHNRRTTRGAIPMLALVAIPLTCWLCTLLALPGKPLPGNDVADLVYSRLLGRQQRLLTLAFIATATLLLTFIVAKPERVDQDLAVIRQAHAECRALANGGGDRTNRTCYEPQAGGGWLMKVLQRDGSGQVVGTVAAPLFAPAHWDDPHTANR